MTTKEEMIAIIQAENLTLQIGDDEQGYTPILGADYDAQILEWADNRLAKEARLMQTEAANAAKAAAQAKLAALGLTTDDLKALGL